MTITTTPQRTWTKTGRRYTTAKHRAQVEEQIAALNWAKLTHLLPAGW